VPKFKCEVKVIATRTYEVEIEADDESKAEIRACAVWREHTPDFDIDKPDSFEVDSEQLTFECLGCGAPIANATIFNMQDERCIDCYAKLQQEDAREAIHG
jgi:hypothetical protein